ncbi:MAG: ABC transporter permease [Nitrososphaerales archaeon]
MATITITPKRRSTLSTLFRKKNALVGAALLLAVLIFISLGTLLTPYAPTAISGNFNTPPNLAHPFGTDYEGHDLLSQIVYGAYPSLIVALEAALGAAIIGFFVGVAGGYFDRTGGALAGLTDITLTFPVLPIIILVSSLFFPTDQLIAVLLIAFLWAPVARAVRAQVLSVKKRPFVDAAKTNGMGDMSIMLRVVAPEVAPLAVAYFIINVSVGVVLVTALQFLGVGNPNAVSWGSILYWAQQFGFDYGDWWWVLEPGIIISIVATGFALIGFAFEEVMNPRLRKK